MGNKADSQATKRREKEAIKKITDLKGGKAFENLKADWCKIKGLKYDRSENGNIEIEGGLNISKTSINLEEFAKLMSTDMAKEDLEALFNLYDYNHDGSITWREYICVITLIMAGTVKEKIKLIFNCFDDDGNGVLTKEEFKKAANRFSAIDSNDLDKFIERVFTECDKNGDKKVSYKEFYEWVNKNSDAFDELVGVLNIINLDA